MHIWKRGSFRVLYISRGWATTHDDHILVTITFWRMQGHNHTSSKCSRSSGTSDLHTSFLVGWCLGKGQMFLLRPAAQMEIALRTPKVAYHLYTINLCTYTWDAQKSSYVLGCQLSHFLLHVMYWVPRGMVRAPEFDVAEAEEQAPGITRSLHFMDVTSLQNWSPCG